MDLGKAYITSLKFYFRHYKDFLTYIEDYIERAIKTFDTDNPIDEELAMKNPEYFHFLVDDLSEKWWQYSRDFPSEFRANFLSQLYSGVDTHLSKICTRHHDIHDIPKEYKALKGTEWAQKAKYLKKYAFVDFTSIQSEWEFLDQIRQIRNLIIHHHSRISANYRDWGTVKKFIKNNPDLISFKTDIEEKDEDGILLYKILPNHKFEFIIHTKELNKKLLLISEAFFLKLIPQISFRKF